MFDCNDQANHKYFKLSGLSISVNMQLMHLDLVGRRIILLCKKSFTWNIKGYHWKCYGKFTWANDNQTIFYTRQDEKTLRSDKVLDIK
jgi:oligopeptidase B